MKLRTLCGLTLLTLAASRSLVAGDFIYSDDTPGASDIALGEGPLTGANDWIALNHFNVVPGLATIAGAQIVWGYGNTSLGPLAADHNVTIAVWGDPGNTGNAAATGSGAPVLLYEQGGFTSGSGNQGYLTYNFATPVNLGSYTGFYVGYLYHDASGQFPTTYASGNTAVGFQSWIAGSPPGGGDLVHLSNNNNGGGTFGGDPLTPLTTVILSLPQVLGNAEIRALGVPEPASFGTLLIATMGLFLVRFGRRL